MDPGTHLSSSMSPQSPEEQKVMQDIPYLSAVGTFQYLATSTRPDISYAAGVLAHFNKNPGSSQASISLSQSLSMVLLTHLNCSPLTLMLIMVGIWIMVALLVDMLL